MQQYGLGPTLPDVGCGFVCGQEGGIADEWIRLGRLTEYGRPIDVLLDVTSEKVIAIFGKRGQGKSYTLGSLVEGLVTKEASTSISDLKERRAVLLFDTLNIYQWMHLSLSDQNAMELPEVRRQADALEGWEISPEELQVAVWYPAGFYSALDSGHQEFSIRVSYLLLDDWGLLMELDIVRDIKGQLLAEVFTKTTESGWEHRDGYTVDANRVYSLQDLLTCLEGDQDLDHGAYHQETVRAVRQRLLAYSKLPLFQGQGTALSDLLRSGRVSVLLLNRLGEDLRSVLVSVLVRRLIRERSAASELAKDLMVNPNLAEAQRESVRERLQTSVPKTWVVVDEAQNVIPSGRRTFASESLIKLVKEGRNFGLSFVVTTQQPRALDQSIMSQVETFVIHKLVAQNDIEYVLSNIKCPFPDEIKQDLRILSPRELLRDVERGQVVVSDTNSPRAFVMEVRPRVGVHGGFEA